LGAADFATEPTPPEDTVFHIMDEEVLAVQVQVLLARFLFGNRYAKKVIEFTSANKNLSNEEFKTLTDRGLFTGGGSWNETVTNALKAVGKA
jgi:hypothetical protein